ncbi:hypothetical protein V8E36_004860 [Tilletia maclaganii]
MPRAAPGLGASSSDGRSSGGRKLPGRPTGSKRDRTGQSKGGSAGGATDFEDAEEALDAAVGIEERAERFARAQGDKARRLFDEALTVYHRAVELGGDTYADACFNAGRTALVLATGFYTPDQARIALQVAVSHFLTTLSSRLSDPNIANAGDSTSALLTHIGEQIKTTVAFLEQPSEAGLAEISSHPPAEALPRAPAHHDSDQVDEGTVDPFLVDIISSTGSALQALAELDDHYGGQPSEGSTPRAVFSRLPVPVMALGVQYLSTSIAAVRMYALACNCFANAIASSTLRNAATSTSLASPPSEDTLINSIQMQPSPQPANESGMKVEEFPANETALSSTYEGSTNPLTPSGYAEALTDYHGAILSLLALVDANAGIQAYHRPLVEWAAGAGRTNLEEAEQLQGDLTSVGSAVDETERESAAATLSRLRHAPILLKIATLLAAEPRLDGRASTDDTAYAAELSRLETRITQTAEPLLANASSSQATLADVEHICDIADSAMSLAQLRIRQSLSPSNPASGLESTEGSSDLQNATAAWATATVTAKLYVKAYSLLESSPSGAGSAGGANFVLSGATQDGRGGLLSDRQRSQLSISLSLAQISLLRLHPLFALLRAHQASADEARKTVDVLRANAVAYSRRALQQAGLRWVVQYADDAGKRANGSGSGLGSSKLTPQWALDQARLLEHEERVLHDGWEVLSLRAETLMVAIRAGWCKFVSQGDSVRGAAATMDAGAGAGPQQVLSALLQSSSAGLELVALLECLAALTKTHGNGLHAQDKAAESEEIARSWAQESFLPSPFEDNLSDTNQPSTHALALFRVLSDLDADDRSFTVVQSGPSLAPELQPYVNELRLDGLGVLNELAFWDWAARTLVGSTAA